MQRKRTTHRFHRAPSASCYQTTLRAADSQNIRRGKLGRVVKLSLPAIARACNRSACAGTKRANPHASARLRRSTRCDSIDSRSARRKSPRCTSTRRLSIDAAYATQVCQCNKHAPKRSRCDSSAASQLCSLATAMRRIVPESKASASGSAAGRPAVASLTRHLLYQVRANLC